MTVNIIYRKTSVWRWGNGPSTSTVLFAGKFSMSSAWNSPRQGERHEPLLQNEATIFSDLVRFCRVLQYVQFVGFFQGLSVLITYRIWWCCRTPYCDNSQMLKCSRLQYYILLQPFWSGNGAWNSAKYFLGGKCVAQRASRRQVCFLLLPLCLRIMWINELWI